MPHCRRAQVKLIYDKDDTFYWLKDEFSMKQDLPIEYKSNVKTTNLDYYVMLEDHIYDLTQGQSDISAVSARL